jgi:hypothetical protein
MPFAPFKRRTPHLDTCHGLSLESRKSCPDTKHQRGDSPKPAHSADFGSEHQKCRNSRPRTASRAKFSRPCGTQYSISRDRRAPLSCAHEPVTGRVMFFKLSKLLNQEDALSAPCLRMISPLRRYSRERRNISVRLNQLRLISQYCWRRMYGQGAPVQGQAVLSCETAPMCEYLAPH